MSEIMTCMPFSQLVNWILEEKEKNNTIFGVHKEFKPSKCEEIFGRKLETPIGPAAGPNSQLAQNIVASYYSGSRFFELKTIQDMDGHELAACVNKPCILADDECYNCEWSTELYVKEAYEEYVKAWFLLHIICREYNLGSPDGFQFNISVGYNLDDIKKEKTNTFIDDMMEAKNNEVFNHCKEWLLNNIDIFNNIKKEDIESIPSNICNSITISTLHGCPPSEIEAIASYMLEEKHLNTFIKCNPTLLGYEFARKTMDDMGYDYIVFGDFHFKDDLQWEDAIPMLRRLIDLSKEKKLDFGVKITNTFPVDVKENQLPSEEMYMSGKSLYPLSITLASRLAKEFNGKLRIAYSGGADYYNIEKIVECGIWPVTVATTILKPGGYNRLAQISELVEKKAYKKWNGVDVEALSNLAKEAVTDRHHVQSAKEIPSRKNGRQVPLVDCYVAPCEDGCPINQNITKYVKEVSEGKFEEALDTILDKNPLPFITGNICAHPCQTKCTRNFYEENVQIRATKLEATRKAYDKLLDKLSPIDTFNKKVAIIGGGPSGIAAAHYIAKFGGKVTLFEREDKLGGTVRNIIPYFRLSEEEIQKDCDILYKLGVNIQLNTEISNVLQLKEEYDYIIIAIGASSPGMINIEGTKPINAISFLYDFNKTKGNLELGKNVVVIGGGNTAMDVARAAKRNAGVENVSLVYRRTKRYMPADEEELQLAIEDGVEFKNLLAPIEYKDGKLICDIMYLGEDRDKSGRRKVVSSGKTQEIEADTIIVAVGEKVNTPFYKENGLEVGDDGLVIVNKITCESSIKDVFVVGDGLFGPSTIVQGIYDSKRACEFILGRDVSRENEVTASIEDCINKKGNLVESTESKNEGERCLNCNKVCENCVDVCPNRANISIKVPQHSMNQIIHVDYMCNECGNCKSFCPYTSAPYLDKFTLFLSQEHMEDSKNEGFVVLDADKYECKVRLNGKEEICTVTDENSPIYKGLRNIMKAVIEDYKYLLG